MKRLLFGCLLASSLLLSGCTKINVEVSAICNNGAHDNRDINVWQLTDAERDVILKRVEGRLCSENEGIFKLRPRLSFF